MSKEINAAEEKKNVEHKIYLNLPSMSEKAFKNVITRLKEDGAKFDTYNKFWYVTPDNDLNKFKSFLGLPYDLVNEKGKELRAMEAERKAAKEQAMEKTTLMGKLLERKENVESRDKEEPNQGKDNREQEVER